MTIGRTITNRMFSKTVVCIIQSAEQYSSSNTSFITDAIAQLAVGIC